MNEDAVWKAWVKAHHAVGCAEKGRPVEDCRYHAAHIKTAHLIADDLYEQGFRLTRVTHEAVPLAMFGEDVR